MRETDTHLFFYNDDTVFSNWYPVRFQYRGIYFSNSEQAFMYEKALFFGDFKTLGEITLTRDPKEVKALGRKVKNFEPNIWSEVSLGFMIMVNLAKYCQNPIEEEKLLKTGNKVLVEASPYDKIWGVGLHWSDDKILDENNWLGKNLLGKSLMHIRGVL